MPAFFLGCAIGVVLVVCIGAPLAGPWRMRLRYLVNAQVPDPVLGIAPAPGVAFEEVTATIVAAERGRVELVVDPAGARGASRRCALTRSGCSPSDIAMIDGWCATRTPLLMIVDEGGDAHLYGPDGALTQLARVREKIT